MIIWDTIWILATGFIIMLVLAGLLFAWLFGLPASLKPRAWRTRIYVLKRTLQRKLSRSKPDPLATWEQKQLKNLK